VRSKALSETTRYTAMENIRLIPEQASTYAQRLDWLIWALTAISAFFTIGIAFAVILFTIRYHKSQDVNREHGHGGHTALELTWTIIPTFMALAVFAWAAYLYFDYKRVPQGAMEIQVVGKQWMWKIQHPNGRREVNSLHVPTGRPVKLIMTSQDVIHDFFVPAFRTKMDVLPGRYTTLWFEATKPGEYHLFCAEYCGTEHSRMVGTVYVMEPEKYERWLNEGRVRMASASTPEAAGEQLFTSLGCVGCHAAGATQRGPNLAGVFGEEQPLESGDAITVDEEYIRESILNPTAKVVAGYPKLMPTYKGQVNEQDIMNLIAYIKSLSAQES